MGKLANFFIIAGVVFVVLDLLLEGHIRTVEGGALILMAIVFLIAAGRSTLAKIAALSITVYFFAKKYGFINPGDLMSLMLTLFPLFMVLFGLYIIFRAPFKK